MTHRGFRGLILALVGVVLLHSPPAVAGNWQILAPGTTTEDDVLRAYGEPPSVFAVDQRPAFDDVIRFVGFDDFERWWQTGAVARYHFEYFGPSGANAARNGPLGEAHKTVISFSATRKVWHVQWTYLAGLRLHGVSGETPIRITLGKIERLFGKNPVRKFEIGNETTSIYRLRKDQFVVEVEYSGEANDIQVYFSREGIYAPQ